MVNQLRELLHDNAAHPPHDPFDTDAVLRGGRARVRRRRTATGAVLVGAVAVVTSASLWATGGGSGLDPADRSTAPVGPVLQLEDARPAVAGRDYEVLFSHTNENLDRRNGQYVDAVTDDGLVVFRDGPHGPRNTFGLTLEDPAQGTRAELPSPPGYPGRVVEATSERLVYNSEDLLDPSPSLLVLDRATGTWEDLSFPGLPAVEDPMATPWRVFAVGPDGRAWFGFQNPRGDVARTGPPARSDSGEVDDAGATGQTYDVWSVSLSDPQDVRDEQLQVGELAVTEDHLVWSAVTNGVNDRVFVRELDAEEVASFDPESGSRCNLLSLGASDDRIAMGQYCGTASGPDGEVRDDRVQVVSLTGEPVVTLQDSGLDGGISGGDHVLVDAYGAEDGGAYAYDLASDELLRLSESVSKFSMGGPTPEGVLLWDVAHNQRHGSVQYVARLR